MNKPLLSDAAKIKTEIEPAAGTGPSKIVVGKIA
jgi:hypothetical protein